LIIGACIKRHLVLYYYALAFAITWGGLLIARGTWVIWLSITAFLWSLIGLAAAIQLGIPEDLAMPVAGRFWRQSCLPDD
jgi:hypothetical protein